MGIVPGGSDGPVNGPECQRSGRMLAALRGGERQACRAFVDAHYRGVYRFFLWLTGHQQTAEDLTQETFAAFWESLADASRKVGPDPKARLYGIARNRWRKRCRDRRGREPGLAEALEVADAAPGPEERFLAAADAEAVRRAVRALPADYREALALRVFEEMSYEQIGKVLGIEPGLARWRVYQARQRLRSRLTVGK